MRKLNIIIIFVFLSSLMEAQNWLWANQFQPSDNMAGMGIKAALDGNLYCGGAFHLGVTFNNGKSVSGSGYQDGFVARFDSSGLCQWVQKISATSGCGCTSMGTGAGVAGFDSQGNIIVTGSYCGCSASFGSGITSSSFGYNIFIAKYTPQGQCLWVQ